MLNSKHGRVFRGLIAGLVAGAGCVILCLLSLVNGSLANGILDVYPDPKAPFSTRVYVFPNWLYVPTASFMIYDCEDSVCTDCTSSSLVSVTIMNYGTASGGPGGDIANVYFYILCGSKIDTGLVQMTYGGVWGGFHAWTWSGVPIDMKNPCGDCLCYPSLYLYTDISPCPTDGATIELAPRFDELAILPYQQGLLDSCGYTGPTSVSVTDKKVIKYVVKKVAQERVSPGDTISYDLFYGRPGTGTVYSIWITDTLPTYTHWCDPRINPACSCTVMPDSSWDPELGPPQKLRWTLGPYPTAGGPTGMLTFQVTADWGNTDDYEFGSGDEAAPEGEFVFNLAHMAWDSGVGCAPGRLSNVTATVVKRFLFWKVGDNDMLYAPKPGETEDRIIYSLFLKNLSDKKTWWNVMVWDTVPSELDVWGEPGLGSYDTCIGYTMTPTGCAQGGAGKVLSGVNTILTWKLDLPPGATLTLYWQARVKPSTTSGATAINRASVLALGKTGFEGGTGHSGRTRNFTHEASILLRVMYVSYVGWAADQDDWYDPSDQVYWIAFYPLNRGTNFNLYTRWCCPKAPCDITCAAFATDGGVSPPINVPAGDCVTPSPSWETGCAGARAPARFVPVEWSGGVIPEYTFNFLHKLVANSPVIWELAVKLNDWNQDANTFAGTTSLTFSGYMAYTYCRIVAYPNTQDTLYTINTNETIPTTVHIFRWATDFPPRWEYVTTGDIFNESQWAFVPMAEGHYRVVSSDAKMIVYKGFPGMTLSGSYNDFGTPGPNRENGNLVSSTVPATFYLYAGHLGRGSVAIIGNVSETVEGTYEIWRYSPTDPTVLPISVNISSDLTGRSGYWTLVKPFDTVAATFNGPGNPDIYGTGYDESIFTTQFRLYKVVVKGGPGASFMTYAGRDIFSPYSGGSMVHAAKDADGLPGAQTGREFWIHMANGSWCSNSNMGVQTFNVFCPKFNMHISCESSDGASARYSTDGIDECISFKSLTAPDAGRMRNWKIKVLDEGNPGDAMVQYIMCQIAEKFYTAPFLKQGVFYAISAPSVVYAGQKFCITVVVSDTGGGTKMDYCGTSHFTSSDPGSRVPPDELWCSNVGPCPPVPGCPGADGVKVFCDVSFSKIGLQSVVANDILDGSITGLGVVMVVGVDIKFTKQPQFLVATSGDAVQFNLCWSNYSSATAFGFTITDAVPMGTKLVPQLAADLKCNIPAGVTVDVAYSTSTPASYTTTTGFVPDLARWLRWTVNDAGINTSGCVCFKVAID